MIQHPEIIQGGMGIGVSSWKLARAVSQCGQMGVVSGTALDTVFARHLQEGDPGGDLRRALGRFPFQDVAQEILKRYFIEGGKKADEAYRPIPMHSINSPRPLIELTVAANFSEVYLAKENHNGLVGINFLEKIQLPTLYSIYGAMLAGVGYILMGAGIPRTIPGILDDFVAGRPTRLRLDVSGAAGDEEFASSFHPAEFFCRRTPSVKRPLFVAIVSSATLATTLVRKSTGRVDGFVVEGPTAGGHNAPPRGLLKLSEKGEPLYGERDDPDLQKIRALGAPFWLAGSYFTYERFAEALELGAVGVQVGTPFAFCEESGIDAQWKRRVIANVRAGSLSIFTDPFGSPTGFPFKVVQTEGSLSEEPVYEARKRVCDMGYLRQAFRTPDGTLGYRCAAEPVESYVMKGGNAEDTIGRKCLCNGLISTIGLGQVRSGATHEPPLITAGDDLIKIANYLLPDRDTYHASDVILSILHPTPAL